MATLQEVYNLRYEATALKSRVVAAVAKAAQDVLNEDPSTANHANRVLWAQDALRDAKGAGETMMWGVVGNATIQAAGEAATDGDIQFVVNGLIDTFATGA